MGTNCAPLLADLFLNSYATDFIQGLLKKNEKTLTRSFKFKFRYINDVLSLNNSWFGHSVDRMHPIEIEIKNATDTDRSTSYLDLHLELHTKGRLCRVQQSASRPACHRDGLAVCSLSLSLSLSLNLMNGQN